MHQIVFPIWPRYFRGDGIDFGQDFFVDVDLFIFCVKDSISIVVENIMIKYATFYFDIIGHWGHWALWGQRTHEGHWVECFGPPCYDMFIGINRETKLVKEVGPKNNIVSTVLFKKICYMRFIELLLLKSWNRILFIMNAFVKFEIWGWQHFECIWNFVATWTMYECLGRTRIKQDFEKIGEDSGANAFTCGTGTR